MSESYYMKHKFRNIVLLFEGHKNFEVIWSLKVCYYYWSESIICMDLSWLSILLHFCDVINNASTFTWLSIPYHILLHIIAIVNTSVVDASSIRWSNLKLKHLIFTFRQLYIIVALPTSNVVAIYSHGWSFISTAVASLLFEQDVRISYHYRTPFYML